MKLRWIISSLLFITMFATGCENVALSQWVPAPQGWHSRVAQLLLDESAFPKGWQINFDSPQDHIMDPTVNHVGREWWNPDKGSAYVAESIWRAYAVRDAKEKYTELRQSPVLLASLTPSPDDFYVEFRPPSELSFQSQIADEFYIACGWVVWAYCEVVARYRNYVVDLSLPLEAESQENIRQGLTYIEIEAALKVMDNEFRDFFESQPTPTS